MRKWTNNRPDYGTLQIRNVNEIFIGQQVLLMPDNIVVKITSSPYQAAEDRNPRVHVEMISTEHTVWYDTISLADFNVVPYGNSGKWNSTNYILNI